MKRKKWIKWAVLLVLVVIAAVYCFTWPGREINSDAGVMEGSRTLEAKDAGKVVMLLRRPHIPSVAAICDCAPDLRVSLLSDGVEYQLAIRSHDNKESFGVVIRESQCFTFRRGK